MTKSLKRINHNWFVTTENLLVISSISGSVASIIFQQVAFAAITSIPLSLALSFNSYNRRRLDAVTQQHQASFIQLEQQFLNNREFFNEVIYSLPTRSELADTESRLETRNTTFAEKLDSLKEQFIADLELQQINSFYSEVTNVQQRLLAVESSLQAYNSGHLHTELFEGKIKKLEQQFNNLPLFDLQYRITQVEQLVNNLQISSTTEFTQLHKSLSGEIQSISQQVQALTSKTEALSSQQLFVDLQTSFKNSIELIQHLSKEVDSLRQQIQAISSSVSERIAALRIELQSQLRYVENSDRKIYTDIYELTDWCDKLENEIKQCFGNSNSSTVSKQIKQEQKIKEVSPKSVQSVCEHCNKSYETKPVKGGYFLHSNFCSHSCKQEYERMNGLL